MNPKITFVIPFYNHWDLTHQLLFDIYNYCKGVDEVVVVNNGSTEMHGLAWWEGSTMLPLKVINVEPNEGFLLAANRGMKEASGDYLVLISNDVRINTNIAQMVRMMLDEHPKSVIGGRVYLGDTGWNNFDGRIFPYAEGWLLGTTKAVWGMLGGFDVRFAPNDFEDVDFSTAALAGDCVLKELPIGSVVHMGAQTIGYNPDRNSLTERNRELFREKWVK